MSEPVQTPPRRMTSEEFLAWYDRQPEGHRYELLDGVPIRIMADCEVVIGGERVLMQAERNIHARAKHEIAVQFRREIDRKRLPCLVYGDGMAVRVDGTTVFEPDAMVRCGPDLPPNATVVCDPMIVVERSSVSAHKIDTVDKLLCYFESPHLIHYLIVRAEDRRMIHYRRTTGLELRTATYAAGIIALDPPGIILDLDALFASLPADESGPEDNG